MEKLSMCRVCLIKDVRLHCLVNTYLQEIYELLSGNLLETKDTRPLHACEMCCARLRNCLRLRTACLHSEEVFSHLLEDDSLEVIPSQSMNMLQTTPVLHENVGPVVHRDPNIHPSVTDEQRVGDLQDNIKDKGICTQFIKQENIKSEYVSSEDEESNYSIQNIKVERDLASDDSVEYGTMESYVSKSNYSIPSADQKDLSVKTVTIELLPIDLNSFEKAATVTEHINPTDLEYTSQCNNLNYSENVEMSQPDICEEYKQTVHTSSETHCNENSHAFKYMLTHTGEKLFQCPTCDKCFSRNSKLIIHIRTHTGEKPYKCDTCGKSFRTNSQLSGHTRTHTGKKPYKCETCGKGFTQKVSLSIHSRIHTGEKPYKCDTCGKSFIKKSDLTRHNRIHIGVKLYECDMCRKCFHEWGSLSQHVLTHTGEKPYKCDRCGKCFHRKGSLSRHMRTHTEEKLYKCDTCGKCFHRKSSLSRHIRTHTSS